MVSRQCLPPSIVSRDWFDSILGRWQYLNSSVSISYTLLSISIYSLPSPSYRRRYTMPQVPPNWRLHPCRAVYCPDPHNGHCRTTCLPPTTSGHSGWSAEDQSFLEIRRQYAVTRLFQNDNGNVSVQGYSDELNIVLIKDLRRVPENYGRLYRFCCMFLSFILFEIHCIADANKWPRMFRLTIG